MFTPTMKSVLAPLVIGLGVVAACSSSGGQTDSTVTSAATSFDLSTQSIVLPDGSALAPLAISGSYGASCKLHGGQTWHLVLDQSDRSLEVALNDTIANCPLTLTTIQTRVGTLSTADFTVNPGITLVQNYAAAPSSANGPTGAFGYYANARLTNLATGTYANNFGVVLAFSDEALAVGATAPPAIYAHVGAAAAGLAIEPPNYTLGFDDLVMMVDANKLVLSSSTGHVMLKPGSQNGEEWKIFSQTLASCCRNVAFADIDQLYTTVKPLSAAALGGSELAALNANIPWSSFGLTGYPLPATRALIVKHTGEGAVYSYELFQIRFPAPAGSETQPGQMCSIANAPGSAPLSGGILLAAIGVMATALVRRARRNG